MLFYLPSRKLATFSREKQKFSSNILYYIYIYKMLLFYFPESHKLLLLFYYAPRY